MSYVPDVRDRQIDGLAEELKKTRETLWRYATDLQERGDDPKIVNSVMNALFHLGSEPKAEETS